MIQADQIAELLHLTRRNLVNIGLGLFKDLCKITPSKLHYRLSDAMVGTERSIAFAMPRGFGKSCYAWEFMTAWNILHRKYKYIMFIGATKSIADSMFANVKAVVTSHPILKGALVVIKNTADQFTYMIGGQKYNMAAFGAGQQLRGKRYESSRPDLVIMDDLETTEGTRSEDQRKKMKDWLFADVLPLDVNCRFLFIGTYLHEDCLLANIIENPPEEERTGETWETFRYGVIDYETGEPNWPEKYDAAWITTERKKYITNGMLYRFNTEYMNIAVDKQDRSFNPEQVRFYSYEQMKAMMNGQADILITVDPGIHGDKDHDPTVIMTTAMDSLGNIWMLDVVRKHMIHHEILDEIVEVYRQWNPRQLYIESVQAQKYLLQDLEHGAWPGGIIIPVEAIDGKMVQMGKNRIYGLEGLFHHRKLMAPAAAPWWVDFCDEMVTFPRGKHDDILDCLAYAKMNHITPSSYKMDVTSIMNGASPTVF